MPWFFPKGCSEMKAQHLCCLGCLAESCGVLKMPSQGKALCAFVLLVERVYCGKEAW